MRRTILLGAATLGIAGATVLSAFGVAGCNAIVGAGDYHIAEDASLADAPDVQLPEASLLDRAASPDALTDAEPDVVLESGPPCGTGLPTSDPGFQGVVRGCVLAAGCDPDTVNYSVSDCITNNQLAGIPGTAALANAQTCSDVTNVTGRGYTTTACQGLSNGYHCAGAMLLFCNNNVGSYQDCTKRGSSTCGTYSGGDAGVQAACVVQASCSGEGVTACNGANSLYTCHGGVGFGENCTSLNAACSAQDKTCYYKGDLCGLPDGGGLGEACSGNIRQGCYAGTGVPNTLYRYDCGKVGLGCMPDAPNNRAHCLAPGCSAAQATACKETCKDSTTATFCVGGAKLDVDCTKYDSFSKCGTFTTGSGSSVVQCY